MTNKKRKEVNQEDEAIRAPEAPNLQTGFMDEGGKRKHKQTSEHSDVLLGTLQVKGKWRGFKGTHARRPDGINVCQKKGWGVQERKDRLQCLSRFALVG